MAAVADLYMIPCGICFKRRKACNLSHDANQPSKFTFGGEITTQTLTECGMECEIEIPNAQWLENELKWFPS